MLLSHVSVWHAILSVCQYNSASFGMSVYVFVCVHAQSRQSEMLSARAFTPRMHIGVHSAMTTADRQMIGIASLDNPSSPSLKNSNNISMVYSGGYL